MSLAVKDLHLLRGVGGCGESNGQVSSESIREMRAMEGDAMGGAVLGVGGFEKTPAGSEGTQWEPERESLKGSRQREPQVLGSEVGTS